MLDYFIFEILKIKLYFLYNIDSGRVRGRARRAAQPRGGEISSVHGCTAPSWRGVSQRRAGEGCTAASWPDPGKLPAGDTAVAGPSCRAAGAAQSRAGPIPDPGKLPAGDTKPPLVTCGGGCTAPSWPDPGKLPRATQSPG